MGLAVLTTQRKDSLRQRLHDGQVVLGTWCVLGDPAAIEILGLAGFDFAIIDMEHAAHSFETACNLVRAAEAANITPLLRPPGSIESPILKALDLGAHGLMVPNVKTFQDAENAIRYSFYPPLGARGHSPFTRAGRYSHINAASIMDAANNNISLSLMIEGPEGLECLPSILERYADNLMSVYVGLYDLAKTIGLPGEVQHADVLRTIEAIVESCSRHGVAVGTLCNQMSMYERLVNMGVTLICYQNDTGILSEAANNLICQINGRS